MKEKRMFTIAGEPVAKDRPRFTIFKGHVMTYTPRKTRNAEEVVSNAYKKLYGSKEIITGPIMLTVEFFITVPKSYTKKKRMALAGTWCVKRPDIDNLLKMVQDSLNGVAWKDDCQIVCCNTRKEYTATEEPFTKIIIEEL